MAGDRRLNVAAGLALEEIEDAAAEMGRRAGDIERRPFGVRADGDGAAAARIVVDGVEDAAERHRPAIGDRDRRRQPVDLAPQPAGVALEEAVRLGKRTTLGMVSTGGRPGPATRSV